MTAATTGMGLFTTKDTKNTKEVSTSNFFFVCFVSFVVSWAATFHGQRGFRDMKTFLKVFLIALGVIVAVKLLPVALVLGSILAAVAAVVAALGLSLAAGLLGAGLLLALVLSPIWLPVLALVGFIALMKKVGAKPAAA